MNQGWSKHIGMAVLVMLVVSLLGPPAAAADDPGTTLVLDVQSVRKYTFVIERRTSEGWINVPTETLGGRIEGDRGYVESLPAGEYRFAWKKHRYYLDEPDISTTYWPGVERPEDATSVMLERGSTADLSAFRPRKGGHLTGRVVMPDGSAVPGRSQAFVLTQRDGRWEQEARSQVADDGTFDVGSLDSGDKIVQVFGSSITYAGQRLGEFATTYSGNALSEATARRITVRATETTSTADINPVPNGTLSGTVQDVDGTRLAGVEVTVEGTRSTLRTDSDGRWTTGPLAAGRYEVLASDPQLRVLHQVRYVEVAVRRSTVSDVALEHRSPMWSRAPRIDADLNSPWDTPLTVDPGTLAQDDARITAVRWYVPLTRKVVGTGRTYTPPRSLEGDQVIAVVTAERHGKVASLESNEVTVRSPEYFAGFPRTSTTAPVAHQLLTATADGITPDPTTTTWQWLRDGRAIAGATGPQYRTSADDVGRRVVVQATVTRRGYARSTMRTSAKEVRRASSTLRPRTTARGGRKVLVDAQVRIPGVETSYVDGALDVYRSRKGSDRLTTVRVVDGRVTVTLIKQPKRSRTYWYRFRPSRSGIEASTGRRVTITVR